MIAKFTPHDADVRARSVLQWLVAGQVDSVMPRLMPRLIDANARTELAKVVRVFDGKAIDSMRVIGAQTNERDGVRHVNLSYEMHSPVGWIAGNVATVDSAGIWLMEGVSATRIPQPLEELTRFTLTGKSGLQYVWLLCSVFATLASLGTAAWLATRRAYAKRWRWVLLSLVGLGAFSMDWSSGQTLINPIHLQVGSAGLVRSGPVAPWVLTFAIPIGAIIALMRYRKERRSSAAVGVEEVSSPKAAV